MRFSLVTTPATLHFDARGALGYNTLYMRVIVLVAYSRERCKVFCSKSERDWSDVLGIYGILGGIYIHLRGSLDGVNEVARVLEPHIHPFIFSLYI